MATPNTNGKLAEQANDEIAAGSRPESSTAPVFSSADLADIIRSTEVIVQLMGCVQREAVAVAASTVPALSRPTGSTKVITNGNASMRVGDEHSAASGSGSSSTSATGTVTTISGNGKGDGGGSMRVGANGNRHGEVFQKAGGKDAPGDVYFIVID